MALDNKGSYHMNAQIAKMHDKAAKPEPKGKGKKFEATKHASGFTSKDETGTQEHADLQGVHAHLDQAFGGGAATPQYGKANDGAY